MSFRIGRKFAQHTYPEPRSIGAFQFARNFAYSAEGEDQPIPDDDEVPIEWGLISSGAPAGPDVPITPVATGIIRIIAAIAVGKNTGPSGFPNTISLVIHVNGVEIEPPELLRVTIDSGEFEMIPVLAEVSGLPLGVTANIRILATASTFGASLIEESSSIEVQEVQAATG
jgi:hypothetical protein